LIGSGAVVTKNVSDHALIVGNPGRIIGWVDKRGNRLKFNQDGFTRCGKFRLDSGNLTIL